MRLNDIKRIFDYTPKTEVGRSRELCIERNFHHFYTNLRTNVTFITSAQVLEQT